MKTKAKKTDKEPRLDRRRSLAGVPVLNDNVEIDRDDDSKWVLTVTCQRRPGLLNRFMPPTIVRRHKLDELGTFVLRQIDGRHTVLEIVNQFIEKYRTNRREAELSVVQFCKSLIERQVISIVIR